MSKLYLIPSPLGEYEPKRVLPESVFEAIKVCKIFVVENTRTARRFLSKAGLRGQIDQLEFYELNEHTDNQTIESYIKLFEKGDVGLISEAGLPAVADPGAQLVAKCHKHNIQVVPFVGPSSLMMALMASGLNGQSFAFCGYLPAKTDERRSKLKSIEKQSINLNQSQIFIETPYRNDAMFADILAHCNGNTRLCIAINITVEDEFICTRTIAEWKQKPIVIGKRPCVFILLA